MTAGKEYPALDAFNFLVEVLGMELKEIELGVFLDTVGEKLPWPRGTFEEWARKNCEKGESMIVTDGNTRYMISRESILRYFGGECMPVGRKAVTTIYDDPVPVGAETADAEVDAWEESLPDGPDDEPIGFNDAPPDPEEEGRLNRLLGKVIAAHSPDPEEPKPDSPKKPRKKRAWRKK